MVKRVGAQWFDDNMRNADGSVFGRSRFVAMQIAWETPRTDCFAEETGAELRSHAVK